MTFGFANWIIQIILKGPSCSWSYGIWIYNYLCNQCLSPLKFWTVLANLEDHDNKIVVCQSSEESVSDFISSITFFKRRRFSKISKFSTNQKPRWPSLTLGNLRRWPSKKYHIKVWSKAAYCFFLENTKM